jgi:hypothetical protein
MSDYMRVGPRSGGSRVFQTATKLDSSGNPTAEEFHYQFCQRDHPREYRQL